MFALIRPMIENYLRGMWVKHCIDENQITDELTELHFPKKLEFLLSSVDEITPEFRESKLLQTNFGPLIHNIHDYTHGGLQSVARYYTSNNTISNQRDIEEIKSILKIAVVASSLAYTELIQEQNNGKPYPNTKIISELSSKIFEL